MSNPGFESGEHLEYQEYLGDGVYIGVTDIGDICLWTPRSDRIDKIYLDSYAVHSLLSWLTQRQYIRTWSAK